VQCSCQSSSVISSSICPPDHECTINYCISQFANSCCTSADILWLADCLAGCDFIAHVTLNPALQGPGKASSVLTSLHGYETCAYPQPSLDRSKAAALQDSGVVIVCHLSCRCVWECKHLLSYTLTCSCPDQAVTKACAQCDNNCAQLCHHTQVQT